MLFPPRCYKILICKIPCTDPFRVLLLFFFFFSLTFDSKVMRRLNTLRCVNYVLIICHKTGVSNRATTVKVILFFCQCSSQKANNIWPICLPFAFVCDKHLFSAPTKYRYMTLLLYIYCSEPLFRFKFKLRVHRSFHIEYMAAK